MSDFVHVGEAKRAIFCVGACWYWECSCGSRSQYHYVAELLPAQRLDPKRFDHLEALHRRHARAYEQAHRWEGWKDPDVPF